MDTYKKTSKKKLDRADRIEKSIGIYINSQINLPVILPITSIGNNLVDNIKTYLSNKIEGRCIVDGYIKPNSIDNIAYSSGICQGSNIKFNVVFDCLICNPVEGMIIDCIVENITKAGIKAKIDEDISPLIIFVARDHHFSSDYFSKIDNDNVIEGSKIKIKVIGQRYELNDKQISVIAEINKLI